MPTTSIDVLFLGTSICKKLPDRQLLITKEWWSKVIFWGVGGAFLVKDEGSSFHLVGSTCFYSPRTPFSVSLENGPKWRAATLPIGRKTAGRELLTVFGIGIKNVPSLSQTHLIVWFCKLLLCQSYSIQPSQKTTTTTTCA